jgi:catechol 2,3-dioxygenase-like lactoylglutathione lyase family enzyme
MPFFNKPMEPSTMLDHTSIAVLDFAQSLNFYDATLATLGYKRLCTFDTPEGKYAGFGIATAIRPALWLGQSGKPDEVVGQARGVHLAFVAPNVEAVDAWYKQCLALGGKDNGAPGPRTHYHSGYYGAFIIDPNGWRIEACTHAYTASTA